MTLNDLSNFSNYPTYAQMLRDSIHLAKISLDRDIQTGDITTMAISREDPLVSAKLIAKQDGVLAGLPFFVIVYQLVSNQIGFDIYKKDGDKLQRGDVICSLDGPASRLLLGERTALNFIQHASGIATSTAENVKLLNNKHIKLLDTRKTGPAYRLMDKYSVFVGGGENHRIGLYDRYLIKENHIETAGSVTKAIWLTQIHRNENEGIDRLIEVECTSLLEVEEAVASGADHIMLDNMDVEKMKEAIEAIKGQARIEVSGNVTPERLAELSKLNIDYISMGALTHTVKAFDFTLLFER